MRALSLVDGWPTSRAAAGVIRLEGEGPETVDTVGDGERPFAWASVSKVLVALAVLVASEEGTVDLDEPAGPPGSTLRHLLAHASGLGPDDPVPISAPGVRRIYSNAGFEVLAHHLAGRAGMTFAQYLDEGVLGPLAMVGTVLGPDASPAMRLGTRPRSQGGQGAALDRIGKRARHLRPFRTIRELSLGRPGGGSGLRRSQRRALRAVVVGRVAGVGRRRRRPVGPGIRAGCGLGWRAMKGVILAGGTGTRLHPLTRITNKHLLPIYDRPMVNYAIEAMVIAGISELMVITGGTHAGEFLRLLGNGHEYGIDRLTYGYQEHPGGIAEALGLAERFAGDDDVLVMLADNIVERSFRPTVERFDAQGAGARIVLTEEKDPVHLRNLGVPEFDHDHRIVRIIEKPEHPPSEYAVTGIYCYDPEVFRVITTLEPSGRGELEITDVNNWYVSQGTIGFDVLEGFWGDAGESIDAYYRVNDFVRENGANKG